MLRACRGNGHLLQTNNTIETIHRKAVKGRKKISKVYKSLDVDIWTDV